MIARDYAMPDNMCEPVEFSELNRRDEEMQLEDIHHESTRPVVTDEFHRHIMDIHTDMTNNHDILQRQIKTLCDVISALSDAVEELNRRVK